MVPDWDQLPEELLDCILSKLYAVDRLRFGLVSRYWNSVAANSKYGHSTCLMFYHMDERSWVFFQYNGFFHEDFPQLYKAEIRCSRYGWLLMSRNDRSLFFFDPFNEKKIRELPKHEYPYTTICFFNEPTSSDWIVVGISNYLNDDEIIMGVLKYGDEEWKVLVFELESKYHLSICTPILHCGRLHCLDKKGNISIFDLNDYENSPSCMEYTSGLFPSRLRSKIVQQFLIKHPEEKVLFAVFIAHDERKVSVYTSDLLDNGDPNQWKQVRNLGDKALFVCHYSSFAVTVDSKTMANKVYFTKFHQDSCVYYCLKTRKYHSIDGSFSDSKGYRLKDRDFATWILPRFHRE